MLIALAFLLILFLETVRRERKEAVVLEFKFRLFALRDELREHAIENPEVARKWVFQYLDSTIAKSIKLLPRISVWYLLGLWLTHKNDPSLDRMRGHLEQELLKPENQGSKKIEERLIGTLGQFIVARHILMLMMSAGAIILPVALARGMSEMKRRSLELIVESPETSTLQRFAPGY